MSESEEGQQTRAVSYRVVGCAVLTVGDFEEMVARLRDEALAKCAPQPDEPSGEQISKQRFVFLSAVFDKAKRRKNAAMARKNKSSCG